MSGTKHFFTTRGGIGLTTEKEIKNHPADLAHDRWWIDNKLADIFRFEQRQLQIIGIVFLVIAFISPNLTSSGLLGLFIWFGMLAVILVLIIIYLYYARPRKAKAGLGSSARGNVNQQNYDAYITELETSLKAKASLVIFSYIALGIELVLLGMFVYITYGEGIL